MSDMMKCFVMHGIGKVGVMEKPIPRPGPNDAIIRTTATLICTSDTHTVAGAGWHRLARFGAYRCAAAQEVQSQSTH